MKACASTFLRRILFPDVFIYLYVREVCASRDGRVTSILCIRLSSVKNVLSRDPNIYIYIYIDASEMPQIFQHYILLV